MDDTARIDLERSKRVLREKLLRLMPDQGDYPTPVEGLTLYRRHLNDLNHHPIIYQPVVIVIAQGEKSVCIGSEEHVYGPNSYFVSGVDMPTVCAIRGVSPEHPFLSLSLNLDRSLLIQLAPDVLPRPEWGAPVPRGAMINTLDEDFMDALLRLVELSERPEQVRVLTPALVREIHYRLLLGPFGGQLLAVHSAGTPNNQIAQTILWLKEHFTQPLQVEGLARQTHMAVSTFHKHFKDITAMSPLQYQKRLRLEQAQRLMLAQGLDASRAALAVGYENVQQFTREYKRLFGAPPRRDAMRMRDRLVSV